MERDQSDTDAIRTQIRWGRMFREREGLTPCTSSVRVSCTPIVFSADLQVVFAMLLILARPSAPLWQTGGGCCRCALLACHTGPQTRIAARVAGSVWCVLCMVLVRIVAQICCRKVVCCRSWRVIAASGRWSLSSGEPSIHRLTKGGLWARRHPGPSLERVGLGAALGEQLLACTLV